MVAAHELVVTGPGEGESPSHGAGCSHLPLEVKCHNTHPALPTFTKYPSFILDGYIYRGIKEKEMVLLKAFFFNIAAQNLSRSFRGNFHFYVINWLIKKDSSKMQTLW